ncbi:hypothetical protein SAMN05216371_8288 [Streptomyces sp. TLI_053]|nr:hypothetical protein SAMN05216371_8288 [Streptomyces sp. TLI_053]
MDLPPRRRELLMAVQVSGVSWSSIIRAQMYAVEWPAPARARMRWRWVSLSGTTQARRRVVAGPHVHHPVPAVGQSHQVVRRVPAPPQAVVPVQPERLRGDPHDLGLAVQQDRPIPLQRRLVAHVAAHRPEVVPAPAVLLSRPRDVPGGRSARAASRLAREDHLYRAFGVREGASTSLTTSLDGVRLVWPPLSPERAGRAAAGLARAWGHPSPPPGVHPSRSFGNRSRSSDTGRGMPRSSECVTEKCDPKVTFTLGCVVEVRCR